MNREDYLKLYKEEAEELIADSRIDFTKNLVDSMVPLKEAVMNGFARFTELAKKNKKEYYMFFYFSYLKIDLLHKKYKILLQGMNNQWYLDPDMTEVTFELDFLLGPILELWEALTKASRKYIGKINAYDIQHLIFKEMDLHNRSIAHTLRYLLWDLEQEEAFKEIPRIPYFIIRWGEYRDDTQIVLLRDRDKKEQKQFNTALRKAQREEEELANGFWYQAELKERKCQDLDMQFITFEKCSIGNFDFGSSNLTAARFTETKLKKCSFSECCLEGADFRSAILEEIDFRNANLKNAMFSFKEVQKLDLTAEQMQVIVAEKEDSDAFF